MKIKALLSAALVVATLSASAEYPIYFRDCVTVSPDGGGNLSFPCVEGEEAELGVSNGTPLFAEDGSITLTREVADGGCYFRTKKLTEVCPMEYTVLAMDYKTNRQVNDLVIFYHEFQNQHNAFSGALFTVADDYQTCYVVLDRSVQPLWGDEDHYAANYWWVSWNDANAHEIGWQFTVKNIRLLTLDEAAAECKAAAGPVNDSFSLPNNSLMNDYDPDMECALYTLNPDGDGNGLLQTGQLVRPLPDGCTVFCFDYKMTGEEFSPNVLMHKKANYTEMLPTNTTTKLEVYSEEEVYDAEWKTAVIDLTDAVAANEFAQTFGSNHFMWLQFKGMNPENLLWAKNPRWVTAASLEPEQPDEPETGISVVEAANAAAGRVYNMMGVEVKGELAPGLYIRDGKKFIVK